MVGFIILSDGRAYAPSNWGYDTTVAAIQRALGDTEEERALRAWLEYQTISLRGLGSIDVRELAPDMAQRFIDAIRRAFAAECESGGAHGKNPAHFDSWLEFFHDLIAMIDSVERGEPPEACNPHMNSPLPPKGCISGPGWPTWLRSASAAELTSLADVNQVNWSDTNVIDEDLAEISKLTNAVDIDVSRTRVTATGLPHLMTLARLARLWATGTGLLEETLAPLREKFPYAEICGEE